MPAADSVSSAGQIRCMRNQSVSYLDREAVLDRVGGDEALLKEIAGIFLTEYPSLIDGIREAITQKDAHRLEHCAHTLKGSVSNFGVDAATEAAYQLEILARRKNLDQAPEALRALELHFATLEPALQSLLD